jgi:hypothetical protein
MARNPWHRVLALTATPGGTPDAVQLLVDALHISRIEIRNEESLDLLPYMHKKVRVNANACVCRAKRPLQIMKQHPIEMDANVAAVRDLLVKLMDVRRAQPAPTRHNTNATPANAQAATACGPPPRRGSDAHASVPPAGGNGQHQQAAGRAQPRLDVHRPPQSRRARARHGLPRECARSGHACAS